MDKTKITAFFTNPRPPPSILPTSGVAVPQERPQPETATVAKGTNQRPRSLSAPAPSSSFEASEEIEMIDSGSIAPTPAIPGMDLYAGEGSDDVSEVEDSANRHVIGETDVRES